MTAAETTPIIDIDSHLSEPPDLWTSRVPRKWIDDVPQVRFNPALGVDDWFVGDLRLVSPGFLAMAGHDEYTPNFPKTYAHFDPAALEQFADNMLFETDFPHPTSLSPGPASTAQPARVTVKHALANVPDDVVRKVLFDNAAALYGVQPPA